MKRSNRLVVTDVTAYGTAMVKLGDGTDMAGVSLEIRGQWAHGQVQNIHLIIPLPFAEVIAEGIGIAAPQAPGGLDSYHAAEAAVEEAAADVDTSPLNATTPQLITMLTEALGRVFPGKTATAGLAWARGDLSDHLAYERRGLLYRQGGDFIDWLTPQELRGLVVRARAMADARGRK